MTGLVDLCCFVCVLYSFFGVPAPAGRLLAGRLAGGPALCLPRKFLLKPSRRVSFLSDEREFCFFPTCLVGSFQACCVGICTDMPTYHLPCCIFFDDCSGAHRPPTQRRRVALLVQKCEVLESQKLHKTLKEGGGEGGCIGLQGSRGREGGGVVHRAE